MFQKELFGFFYVLVLLQIRNFNLGHGQTETILRGHPTSDLDSVGDGLLLCVGPRLSKQHLGGRPEMHVLFVRSVKGLKKNCKVMTLNSFT